jgi:hypothetical protein
MDIEPVDHEPLELLARTDASQDPRALRRDIARRLLDLARGERPLEKAAQPGDLAAAFLRRYDNRRSTQDAYARDLAHWFVWLDQAGVRPFDATLTNAESYARQPLPNGKTPAPATVARRMACLSAFYRRVTYDDHIARNPFELPDRPKLPEQAATAGLSKQRARRLITAARAEGACEDCSSCCCSSSVCGSPKRSARTSRTSASKAATASCTSRARARPRKPPRSR